MSTIADTAFTLLPSSDAGATVTVGISVGGGLSAVRNKPSSRRVKVPASGLTSFNWSTVAIDVGGRPASVPLPSPSLPMVTSAPGGIEHREPR